MTFLRKNILSHSKIKVLAMAAVLLLGLTLLHNDVHADPANEEKELFLIAQKAFDDGFYDVAMRYIDQFLTTYPQSEKNIQAQLILGQCYFFKSQYLKAFEIFQGLLKYNEFKDATLFWLGETYFKGADFVEAVNHYEQLIDIYPNSTYIPQAYYSLGWTYFAQDKYEEAKKNFAKLIKFFPAHQLSEDALFKLAECEQNLKNYETAKQFFHRYITKYPQSTRHAEVYFYIAETYYYDEDYLTAVTYYAKAADIAYDAKVSYMAKVSMGWSYLKLGKHELSERYFKEALQIAEGKEYLTDDVFLGEASLYSEMKEYEKAHAGYQKLIELFPNSPRIIDARLGKANISYTLRKYDDAINEYQWLIDNYGNDPQRTETTEKAYYGLAWTYLKSGNIDQAIKSFELIMNKTTNHVVKVSALTQIGDAYQEINQLDKAIEVYDHILKQYPDSLYTDYVQFRQGIALLKLEKIEAATLSFKSLQTYHENSKYINDSKYYLGVAYFKKEDWGQAVKFINEYLADPSTEKIFSAEADYITALSYFNLKDYQKALTMFERIQNNYPDQATMLRVSELNAAKCLYNLRQTNEALQNFQKIIAAYPNSDVSQDATLWLADHHLQNNELDAAIAYYQDFIKNYPGSEKLDLVYYELGQAHQAKGELDNALNYYRLIKDSSRGKEIYAKAKLTIADIFSKDDDPQSAIHTYQNIASSTPDFKRDALVKIANIHIRNNQYQDALDAYKEALKADKSLSQLENVQLQFSIADTYELLNNTQKAVEAYLKIPYLYTQKTDWIVKSYLRIARIFEEEENWQEAKITYNKLVDLKTQESKYAIERIEWINKNILAQFGDRH